MFVWMKKRYLYSDDTVGASLDETWSAYKSGKHTNLSGSSLKKKALRLLMTKKRISRKSTLSKSGIFQSRSIFVWVFFRTKVTYTKDKEVS